MHRSACRCSRSRLAATRLAWLTCLALAPAPVQAAADIAWPHQSPVQRQITAIAPPTGHARISLPAGSFGAWLRALPLLPAGSPVLAWTGKPIAYQVGHAAVVDLDVGRQDLQQCADSILRLRGEYFWATGRPAAANDLPANVKVWRQGNWRAYRRYLNSVMAITGSKTMDTHMRKAGAGHRLMPGDVLVQGGFPGHAVLILDAADAPDGRRKILIGQSYMPAQQFHVILPPGRQTPWFDEADVRARGISIRTWPRAFRVKDVRVW